MSGGFLLPTLAFVTLALVIAFALWSKRRTDKSLEGRKTQHSTLARDEPDPNFLPEQERSNGNDGKGSSR